MPTLQLTSELCRRLGEVTLFRLNHYSVINKTGGEEREGGREGGRQRESEMRAKTALNDNFRLQLCINVYTCEITVVSRVNAHGRLNITREFGPHERLPGI